MLLFSFLESSFNISPDYLRLKVSACEKVRPQHLNMSIIKELSTIILVLKTPKISTIFKMIIKGIDINKYKWDIKCKRKSVKITIMYAKQFCLTTLASNKCTMFAGNKFLSKLQINIFTKSSCSDTNFFVVLHSMWLFCNWVFRN